MTPHQGITILFLSTQQLPRLCEGLFELTRVYSRSLDSSRALLPELQRNKDTIRCEGSRTPAITADAILDCAFVKSALFLQ